MEKSAETGYLQKSAALFWSKDKMCIRDRNKNIKVIHHLFNLGYGEAVKSGFYASEHQWIVLFLSLIHI